MRYGFLVAATFLAGCENQVSLELATSGALEAQHVRMALQRVSLQDDAGNVVTLDSSDATRRDLLNFDSGSTIAALSDAKLGAGRYVGLALTFDGTSAEIVDANGVTWPIAVPNTPVFAPIDFSVRDKDKVSLWASLDLRLSLSDQSASSGNWQFAQRLQVVNLDGGASLSGTISQAVASSANCLQGRTSPTGAAVYAYPQPDLTPYDDSANASPHPSGTAAVTWNTNGTGTYAFPHLKAGRYTVALNCRASADDPQVQQGQVFAAAHNVTLAAGQAGTSDF